MSSPGSGPLVIERILRDRQSVWQQIVREDDLGRLSVRMLISSVAALAGYGAVLGSFHGPLMAVTSAVKLPLLFLVTLAICLPTLYLFNLVFGARLSVRQAVALVMVAITVTSMLAAAFAPISLFFLITAPDYGFFKLLNVAILSLSAVVGLRFLTGGMHALSAHGLLSGGTPTAAGAGAGPGGVPQPASAEPGGTPRTADAMPTAVATPGGQPAPVPVGAGVGVPNGGAGQAVPAGAPVYAVHAGVPGAHQPVVAHQPLPGQQFVGVQARAPRPTPAPREASMTLLYIWILLFGFVGTQLAWTLRPFFGSPGEDFALFRSIEGNFYAEIIRTIAHL
ncbi:MAG TPA: hypothetical protein VES42_02080 [Pilimelia sp.]|nr:hypothetical protein [Pilimelia sp.]